MIRRSRSCLQRTSETCDLEDRGRSKPKSITRTFLDELPSLCQPSLPAKHAPPTNQLSVKARPKDRKSYFNACYIHVGIRMCGTHWKSNCDLVCRIAIRRILNISAPVSLFHIERGKGFLWYGACEVTEMFRFPPRSIQSTPVIRAKAAQCWSGSTQPVKPCLFF